LKAKVMQWTSALKIWGQGVYVLLLTQIYNFFIIEICRRVYVKLTCSTKLFWKVGVPV
jgi:hypothetical protein